MIRQAEALLMPPPRQCCSILPYRQAFCSSLNENNWAIINSTALSIYNMPSKISHWGWILFIDDIWNLFTVDFKSSTVSADACVSCGYCFLFELKLNSNWQTCPANILILYNIQQCYHKLQLTLKSLYNWSPRDTSIWLYVLILLLHY